MTSRLPWLAACLLCLAPHGAAAQPVSAAPAVAAAVAVVTEVSGAAHVASHDRAGPIEVAAPLADGAVVSLSDGARIVLAYPGSGSVYELAGPGRFQARRDTVVVLSAPGRVMRRDLAAPLRRLRIRPEGTSLQASAAMRGGDALELQAQGPSGAQRGAAPLRVCWRQIGGGWTYRIELIDDDGRVRYAAVTGAADFQFPESVPLQPNRPYLWHVRAQGPERQSIEAAGEFSRMDAARDRALAQAEAIVGATDQTARILLNIALQQSGVVPSGSPACAHDAQPASLSRADAE